MPNYTYQCDQGHTIERTCTIAEMELFERGDLVCPACPNPFRTALARVFLPPRRHVAFKEGFYEHISENGEHISSMSDLRRIAKENGNYSLYAEDLGGLFRAKEGRWI